MKIDEDNIAKVIRDLVVKSTEVEDLEADLRESLRKYDVLTVSSDHGNHRTHIDDLGLKDLVSAVVSFHVGHCEKRHKEELRQAYRANARLI